MDIAKQVDVTERTVRTRMRRLEDAGVVRGYTIREAGIGLTALVRLKVGPGTEIGSLAGEFSAWPGVECVYEISGDADLVAVVHVDDTVALRNLLDESQKLVNFAQTLCGFFFSDNTGGETIRSQPNRPSQGCN